VSSTMLRRGLAAAVALLIGFGLAATAQAEMFYREVAKDGRIYVFATMSGFETWDKAGGAEMGKAITRLGYGPAGETMVFDSEDAINLYNFKHDRPGEVFVKPKEAPKSEFPKWKISGLVFGDYYYFTDHHDKFDDQNGFWIRRAYFTYEHNFSEKFYGRFRLEANSNGQLAGGNLVPFVKDVYLRWNYYGKQQAIFGISPTLTFDAEEAFWGLRHIEKTPADLYRIDSSRDGGLTLSGPIGDGGFSYGFQVGNDAGNGSETDKFKTVRFLAMYNPKEGLHAEGNFNWGARSGDQDRTTAKGLLGYKKETFRVGAEYLYQERKSGKVNVPKTKIDIWSGFAVWEFAKHKADIFGRFDNVKSKLGGIEGGLPGADGIDYLLLSTKSPFKGYIFGMEYYLFHPGIRISPNVEVFDYKDNAVKNDTVARFTVYWTW
jgi:hypothetical protein